MHPEPGNVEAQYCSHARWLTGIFSRSTLLQAPGTCTRPLTVSIFSPAGRLIRELELNRTAAWDGTDADGNRLPAGVYLCRAGNLAPARLVLGD
jgi:hypothetical protein